LKRFPTLQSWAAASQHEVLKFWQGLGYYRRAVNLHRAAIEVVERHQGHLSADPDLLRHLPGVGRYMAGAILSFAFNRPAPVVEANTSRVLCRLFAVRRTDGDSGKDRRLWELAELLLSPREPGAHNQAMMELGALVCLPRRPRCEVCPVSRHCQARARGLVEQLPEARQRPKPVTVRDAAAIVRRRGRVLIVRRPAHGRWAGLWELPRVTVDRGADSRACLRTHVRDSLGLKIELGREVLAVKHGVTHHRITLHCFEATAVTGRARANGYAECRWELPSRLHEYAFSSPQRRVIAAIGERGSRRCRSLP
jgi:A/G-specific adenine glycosylase